MNTYIYMNYSYLEKPPVEDTHIYETKYQWECRCNASLSSIDHTPLMNRKPIFPSFCTKCRCKRTVREWLIAIE